MREAIIALLEVADAMVVQEMANAQKAGSTKDITQAAAVHNSLRNTLVMLSAKDADEMYQSLSKVKQDIEGNLVEADNLRRKSK